MLLGLSFLLVEITKGFSRGGGRVWE